MPWLAKWILNLLYAKITLQKNGLLMSSLSLLIFNVCMGLSVLVLYHFVFVSFSITVKKKYGAGLKFNLMNIGKKKTSLLDSPEKCVDTSGE